MSATPYVLFIPEVALEKIFSFLSYDEIAKNRIVCRRFNEIGSALLSRGFIQLEKRHALIFKRVKSMLPRRESERRSHSLARHSDILQGIQTRITMMNMTYFKYIVSNVLCFIPGKVLDEIRSVLRMVETQEIPPRADQLLQELRDLSSMAMEHFDEHILPRIKEQSERRTTFNCTAAVSILKKTLTHNSLSNEVYKVKKQSKTHKHNISYLAQSTQKLCSKLRRHNMRLRSQSRKLKEQERKIQEQNNKIEEQENTLADIKKHIDECDQKYTDLTTELVRARDEILAAASSPPAPNTSTSSAQTSSSSPKVFRSNIKPRTARILPKRLNLQLDLERKRKSNLLPEIPIKRNRTPSEQPDFHHIDSSNKKESNNNAKRKKMKFPDLIDYLPADQRCPEGMCNNRNSGGSGEGKKASTSSTVKFSKSYQFDIGDFKKPLIRKRKMTEDIDLK